MNLWNSVRDKARAMVASGVITHKAIAAELMPEYPARSRSNRLSEWLVGVHKEPRAEMALGIEQIVKREESRLRGEKRERFIAALAEIKTNQK